MVNKGRRTSRVSTKKSFLLLFRVPSESCNCFLVRSIFFRFGGSRFVFLTFFPSLIFLRECFHTMKPVWIRFEQGLEHGCYRSCLVAKPTPDVDIPIPIAAPPLLLLLLLHIVILLPGATLPTSVDRPRGRRCFCFGSRPPSDRRCTRRRLPCLIPSFHLLDVSTRLTLMLTDQRSPARLTGDAVSSVFFACDLAPLTQSRFTCGFHAFPRP